MNLCGCLLMLNEAVHRFYYFFKLLFLKPHNFSLTELYLKLLLFTLEIRKYR